MRARPGIIASRRIALALLDPGVPASELDWALGWLEREPPKLILEALRKDHVDQLVLHTAAARGLLARLPERLVKSLTDRRLAVVGTTLRQEQVLAEASAQLDEAGVDHVVFKGALLRHILYSEPHLRPCMDVDLLVSHRALPNAILALKQRGFAVQRPVQRGGHELILTRQRVHIDLHSAPIRRCRMRRDVTEDLLARRVRHGPLWSPSDSDNTALTLVHPAITEYVTGRLVRAVDLDRWLRSRSIDWDRVLGRLSEMGLRTAAWAMLRWTCWLFHTPLSVAVRSELEPPSWHAWYFEQWLALDPAKVYAHHPWMARGGFSLALHDGIRDAGRAASGFLFAVR